MTGTELYHTSSYAKFFMCTVLPMTLCCFNSPQKETDKEKIILFLLQFAATAFRICSILFLFQFQFSLFILH